MSNRLIGLLIILAFILGIIAFYLYAFVSYTGGLEVRTNMPGYSIGLSGNKALDKNQTMTDCPDEVCIIPKLSPFEYDVTLTKEGYITKYQTVVIPRRENALLEIIFEKKVNLVSLEERLLENGVSNEKSGSGVINGVGSLKGEESSEEYISPKEKLEKLRKRKKYYKYFEVDALGDVFFQRVGETLHLGVMNPEGKSKILERFSQISPKQEILLHEVIGNENNIVIEYGEKKFLYNAKKAFFEEIELNFEIEYIKTYAQGKLAFITPKGMFLYDRSAREKFEYNINFFDSVKLGEDIIGLIKADDTGRRKGVSGGMSIGDIIVLHTPKTGNKKHIYSLDFAVAKMYVKAGSIILEGKNEEQFILENY